MLDLRIAEIGPASGPAGDGIVRGSVAQSLLTAALSNAQLASAIYAYRKDVSGLAFSFADVSLEAASEASNSFAPFGSSAQMSAGDELYIACDDFIKELYFDIDTPGVWSGTGFEIAYSNDGQTANALVQGLNDESNGFRNPDGVYRVSFTPPSDIQAFSPTPGMIASRRWLVIRPMGLVGVTTAPLLRRIWIVHNDSAVGYSDFSSVLNAALGDSNFSAVPATIFYVEGNLLVYALPFLAYGFDHRVHRRVANVAAQVAEYLASDGSWKALPNFVDGSAFFTNGPASLGDPTQDFTMRWSIPADWGQATQSFAGIASPVTGYFIRFRVTSVTSRGPASPPLVRSRVRAFGAANSNGLKFIAARTLIGVNIGQIGIPSTQAVTVQFVNINTGRGASFTIPANALGPNYFALDPSLALAAGESLLIAHSSGGSIADVELNIQYQ